MKTTMIYLVVLLMVASTAFAQKTGFIDDVYFKPSDARNIEIKASERQKPVVKNGARQIVFVDANNTDVIVTKDTVFVLGKSNAKADTLNYDEEEGGYINGFNGNASDLEYAERIRRFHNPRHTIHISSPAWNDIYFLNSWDWNVYVDGSYAWVTPTWTNRLWFDYHYRPFRYNSWYGWNSWHSPYYSGWGGYGWGGFGGWNSWSHGYHSGYYAGYYGWPYGYGGGFGGYYGYGNYWNSWGGSHWGGGNFVSNNNRGRATDYNFTGTRQSTVNSGGGSAGAPAYASGTRSSYSAIGGSTQMGSRSVSTGTRSISTSDRSQSAAPGFTRTYSSERSVDGRSYSTQGTRNSNFDNRTSTGTAATSSGSRSATTSSPSSRSYSTAPASSRSYSTTPSSTRSSSTYTAPSSTRSSSSYSAPSTTRSSTSSSSSSSSTYRSSSSSTSTPSVSNTRSSSSSSSSSYSSGMSGGSSSSSGSRSSSSSSSSSSGTRR